jgi:hypothetical protein
LGSILIVGWRGVGERIDEELGSTGKRFVMPEDLSMQEEIWFFPPQVPSAFQLEASVAIPEGCHSQVEVDTWLS